MATTFTCDRCGNEFPRDEMKEVFKGAAGDEQKMELCPTCLDEVMNESPGEVRGVEGDEKQAAAHIGDEPPADRESYGVRE